MSDFTAPCFSSSARPDFSASPACFVGGAWIEADSRETFPVLNPATREVLAHAPLCGAAETGRAIAAAEAAFPAWRARMAKERSALLRRWNDLILREISALATLITAECGKPLAEAEGEVRYGASFLEWFAEEGKRAYGEIIPSSFPDRRVLAAKMPIGVCAAITPWNFPMAMITRKVAPALAAGCTVIIKPAEETPLSAFFLARLAEEAGFPRGVLNVISGDAQSIGKTLTESPVVRHLSFTGSTEVGRLLMAQCAPTIKRVALELGGNAPFIVFDDADLEAAVTGAMEAKFRNTGQTCVCANRFLVQSGVYEDFAARFTRAVSQLKVGDGREAGVRQGPLINADAMEKVRRQVADAVERGARVLTGGTPHSVSAALGGAFFTPTVLADAKMEMLIAREETFGPVAPLFRFSTESEAISLANAVEHGLAAYFYSRDFARVTRVSEALEFGMVGVNTGVMSTEAAPFGGIKQSGFGREGGRQGLEEYLDTKYLCLGGIQ
ncbi:MAG: NAD-dependent succinate-semialdehyde dehydrogenase [Zoogloeaceae bacterium]|nr:NAD-dependent succinate-semialdehyde dehydrogenase [Zoogloeaceae bacterium]